MKSYFISIVNTTTLDYTIETYDFDTLKSAMGAFDREVSLLQDAENVKIAEGAFSSQTCLGWTRGTGKSVALFERDW